MKITLLSRKRLALILPTGFLLVGILAAIFIGSSHRAIRKSGAGRTYEDVNAIPHRPAALVLGCSKTLASGRSNLFFRYRIEAAAGLYHAGKTDYLIVSGDNSHHRYDEPTDMRDALIAAGVPGDRIYRDYAGFRTLDSVLRAREIFGQEEFTIVSQPFHNERAIYIALGHGIDAIAFNAADVARFGGLRTRAREYLARCLTVLDLRLLGTMPKFLGPAVPLGGPVS
jgi:SanA protein